MKKYKLIAFIVILLGIGMMIYAGLRWSQIERVYQEGNAAYMD